MSHFIRKKLCYHQNLMTLIFNSSCTDIPKHRNYYVVGSIFWRVLNDGII